MRVIAVSTLRRFWSMHADAEQALRAWHAEARKAGWKTPEQIKRQFPAASIIADNRVVFNICGNRYRLVVKVLYEFGVIYIRFVGKHEDYDRIDAERV
jgi:mRNA interferase HigB